MQFAKNVNSKKNYQCDFLVIETSLCINIKLLSAHFCPFLNKCGPKMAIFSTKKGVFNHYAPTMCDPSQSDKRSGEVSDQYVY